MQNAIFRRVSREVRNLFTVGDVKQSIYRFRLADPTIFLDKYKRFASAETATEGKERKILLSQNFRSRRKFWTQRISCLPTSCRPTWERWNTERMRCLHFGAAYYPQRTDCDTEFHLIAAHQRSAADDAPGQKAAGRGTRSRRGVSVSFWTRAIPSPGRTARCGRAARRTS